MWVESLVTRNTYTSEIWCFYFKSEDRGRGTKAFFYTPAPVFYLFFSPILHYLERKFGIITL